MTKPRINWDLGFGFSLGFGAWSLGFRPWPWVLLFDAFEIDPESYVVADGADHEGHAVVAAFDGEGSAETGADGSWPRRLGGKANTCPLSPDWHGLNRL